MRINQCRLFGNFTPEGQQIIVNENNAGDTSAIAVITEGKLGGKKSKSKNKFLFS
jgi:hypothetical protein